MNAPVAMRCGMWRGLARSRMRFPPEPRHGNEALPWHRIRWLLRVPEQTEELTMAELDWKPDILGAGYSQVILDLGTDPDGQGTVEAVLVRRDPRPGETPLEEERGAVLYVHGFTDYFFQTELADFFAARGLQFYALDLRKCGRARKPGHTAHYVSDLALYDD